MKKKAELASDVPSDKFMYQDKEETQRELDAAHQILNDLPSPLIKEEVNYRKCNTPSHARYRGDDEPDVSIKSKKTKVSIKG
ncbi:sulfate adenylyltransferase [Carnobacterium iners]|uniref:Sulfate adenylyltransferase n=1 Tax=Carnobacterium iners TaxID=1073423 RepID=A0A1X7MUR2_9LACT|nr:hypothetical protein [Carnobacterium iners]SEK92216.1 sulfate adenylyltransferase [Carnobacterium iners]SMH27683.1 sulfate adenylyltransferase [Carnobacterium iners]